jgi:hypothetical protein
MSLAMAGEAITIGRDLADAAVTADALSQMCWFIMERGNLPAALAQIDEAVALARATGDPRLMADLPGPPGAEWDFPGGPAAPVAPGVVLGTRSGRSAQARRDGFGESRTGRPSGNGAVRHRSFALNPGQGKPGPVAPGGRAGGYALGTRAGFPAWRAAPATWREGLAR